MPSYIVAASANGRVGISQAFATLAGGGSALDAVEVGCRLVESNPEDHTVGLGGLPNLLGNVELDASIMDGRTRATGAVGAVKEYEHPISIARLVMERTPHVLLVGEGAGRFAAEMGFERAELLTEEARRQWESVLREEVADTEPGLLRYHTQASQWLSLIRDPERPAGGTINFLALDREGDLACGVSTSGWYFKYPGRLGDSPVVGAGNYADNRYGAAACTGRGELAVRAATAHSVVMHLRWGASVEEAVRQALEDANSVDDPYATGLNVIAMDRAGNHAAASNRSGATYIYQEEGMEAPAEKPRVLVGTHLEGADPPP